MLILIIIIIIFLVLLLLCFGRVDTIQSILNVFGLSLKSDTYEKMKAYEYEKFCKKAIHNGIKKLMPYDNGSPIRDEKEFLYKLIDIVHEASRGKYVCRLSDYDDSMNMATYKREINDNLGVKELHYLAFVEEVLYRRCRDVYSNDAPKRDFYCDFFEKSNMDKYVEWLWQHYQKPWPKDWKQFDGKRI